MCSSQQMCQQAKSLVTYYKITSYRRNNYILLRCHNDSIIGKFIHNIQFYVISSDIIAKIKACLFVY